MRITALTSPLDTTATRIAAHLRRFEDDPEHNAPTGVAGHTPMHPYYHPSAYRGGRYVMVSYMSYQGYTPLSKVEALAYLDWLDHGGVGTHYEMRRQAQQGGGVDS